MRDPVSELSAREKAFFTKIVAPINNKENEFTYLSLEFVLVQVHKGSDSLVVSCHLLSFQRTNLAPKRSPQENPKLIFY